MRTNFVLIDSENVKPEYIEKLMEEHFRVTVFVGARQKRLDFTIAKALQSLGSNGSYVQVSSNAPEALDLHIAYCIGKASAAEPDAYFHIISKDKGFDSLIDHLKTQKIFCARSESIPEMPVFRPTPKQQAKDFYEKRIAPTKARPSTVTSLQRTILSHFNKTLSTDQVATLVKQLAAAGYIEVKEQRIVYPKRSNSGRGVLDVKARK